MGCHHSEGGLCVVCGDETDTCCGDDKDCDTCGNEYCIDCYEKHEEDDNFVCPVCTRKIVTDKVIVDYFLKKYNLTRKDVIKEIQNEYNIKLFAYK
jgi:uncharacterized ferredoxin-like protein